jgi:hypothetical protein
MMWTYSVIDCFSLTFSALVAAGADSFSVCLKITTAIFSTRVRFAPLPFPACNHSNQYGRSVNNLSRGAFLIIRNYFRLVFGFYFAWRKGPNFTHHYPGASLYKL